MKIRPYLTYKGNCQEALYLYKRAFRTEIIYIMRFEELPPNPNFDIPKEYNNKIVQATLKVGDEFIRLSDCGPNMELNDVESERISLTVEADVESVKYAFDVLAEEGRIGMPLNSTFYSPCAGVVFDKFGVMWNLVAEND